MTGTKNVHLAFRPARDAASTEYLEHSRGLRCSTDTVLADALRAQYPELHLTLTPRGTCDLLAFAGAGHARCTPVDESSSSLPASSSSSSSGAARGGEGGGGGSVKWRMWFPAARRLDGGAGGALVDVVRFEKYLYEFRGQEHIVYVATGQEDGLILMVWHGILSATPMAADELVTAASRWGVELHQQIWVFDQGWWQKSGELWQSVQKAEWEDVILDEGKKKAIIGDVDKFFDSRGTYERLKVPWKRGVIFHGPPGNGKTISIKATMHSLFEREDPVPTLYVRTLASFSGPQWSLSQIFTKARQTAPCYLVFEDLDSIVSDDVRSYFLNEVDGLNSNDGIYMIGSTNHLDQLDPGIAKRPSRFDRKIYFPEPNMDQRIQYCHYWQGKLADNPEVEFPDKLCTAIARITDKFSFAYMQEAFVAALLAIAAREDEEDAEKSDMQQLGEDAWHPGPRQYGEDAKRHQEAATQCSLQQHGGDETEAALQQQLVQDAEGSELQQQRGPEAPPTTSDSSTTEDDLVDFSVITVSEKGDDKNLDDLVLWREIQKQIKILREEMDSEKERITKQQVAAERAEMGIKRAAVRELQHGRYGEHI
ncbi:P-loop containing nucleoside triphosphate hydrolase protein [Viridothelium virens]|uniref:P-loop containing nucleoside triphosphate hydrolase protein n=1 Tax=Viridothelium virens TaxID=1048519 RepID=A0A6A6HBU6_VIRVR|nr:P-loop containing nucleoside triphosphate hydrolase protein [Viridothelium virens]